MPNKFYNQSWFNWLILIIITAGLGWFFYTQFYVEPVDWGDDEKSELGIKNQEMDIEVIDNGDGTKTVRNVGEGYEVVVPEDWSVNSVNSNLNILNEKENNEEMYAGVSLSFKKISYSDPLEYFEKELNILGDEGVSKVYKNSFNVGQKKVKVLKVDYSTSYFPSNGEIIYIYHFVYDDQYMILTVSSLDESKINGIQDYLHLMIGSIIGY